ncbi:MAG: NUDIX domain-containing protein [Paludibacter sp.]|nr:NUDIX domain-containing protein [Paludibacter sp.]
MKSLIDIKKLSKQIRESFLNPVLQFLPLLVFLVVDDFCGISLAWKISFPVSLILLAYIYFLYNGIFIWHLIFTTVFLMVTVVSAMVELLPLDPNITLVVPEAVSAAFLLGYLVVRKQIEQVISQAMPKLIPMTNNFHELYRVVITVFSVLVSYIAGSFLLNYFDLVDSDSQKLLIYAYIVIFICLIVYEVLRVHLVRTKLMAEEWWPIVTDQGKIIGNIEHKTSLKDDKKYMHPIVRVLLIDKGLVLLQKRSAESVSFPGMWDTAISNHVKMGETIEQCVERTAKERYSITNLKYMFLANYTGEVEPESYYAFLFVSCQETEFIVNLEFADQLKWWTQQQIEDNLESGIFTDIFKTEYDLLLRSGLLETGKCECSCKLKEVIYQQSNGTKKEELN